VPDSTKSTLCHCIDQTVATLFRSDTRSATFGRSTSSTGFTSTGPDFAAHIRIAVPLLLLSVVYAYRAYRFGVHSAREMFVQFLVLDGSPSANAPEE
jgi:hypothetical protein